VQERGFSHRCLVLAQTSCCRLDLFMRG
jgi:hypothetical protein